MPTTSHGPDCRCCQGLGAKTPRRLSNPPGRASVDYRVGRHADFLDSMKARLSSADFPALAALSTREPDDFTIAIADALASSLDVLTFYTERLANEHYLRTATERLSVGEMARLIGYQLAPGVAVGTHLAFTLQATPGEPDTLSEIPTGTRVQSVPGQDEQAQTFETVAPVKARATWNAMSVRSRMLWRPRSPDTVMWLSGLSTQLEPGDAILILGAARLNDPSSANWAVRLLSEVSLDRANERTRICWKDPLGPAAFPSSGTASVGAQVFALRQRTALFGHNAPDPNLMGNNDSNVGSLINDDDGDGIVEWNDFEIDMSAIDLDSDSPKIGAGSWFALVSNETSGGSSDLPGVTSLHRADRVYHRTRTAFALSSRITRIVPDTSGSSVPGTYSLRRTRVLAASERLVPADTPLVHPVYGNTLTLSRPANGLEPGQPLALSGPRQRIAIAEGATGLSLALDNGDATPLTEGDELFLIAPAVYIFGPFRISLPPEVLVDAIGLAYVELELRLMDRNGERGTLQVPGNEIRLAEPRKDDPLVTEIAVISEGEEPIVHDRDHTYLKLDQPLTNVYERASLRINANVARATHGETVEAILGSGDGSMANQRFTLGQGPLTFVSAATASGRASTLQLRVNDVLWSEVPTLHGAAVDTRVYATTQDDDAVTTVEFGDGLEGARLPSGESNIRVRYRKGIGAAGNVARGRLTTLLSRPLGVTGATNPDSATGGEDAETLDRARVNAPLTVLTLDRAVSIEDYANFTRAFAGIDKAHAVWIPAGPGRGVFLTIAGVDGAEVPETSDTFENLRDALTSYGDPLVPLRIVNAIDARFRCRLSVKVSAGYETDPVLEAVRAALGDAFGFARRDFGQTVSVDEVSAVAQGVAGVDAVHVTRLHRVGNPPIVVPRLFATLPVASATSLPEAAELLTLSDEPVELEVLA